MSAFCQRSRGRTRGMTVWLDAQLSPSIAVWLQREFFWDAKPVRALGLRDASDREIYFSARQAKAIVLTKDSDFVDLVHRHGSPPRVIWITCGNTSNDFLQNHLKMESGRIFGWLDGDGSLLEL